MTEMTDRARRRLDAYLQEARRALEGRSGLDVEGVLQGLREHVDAELGGRGGAEPVTAEEMDRVLERLGAPDALAAEGGPAAGAAAARRDPGSPSLEGMGRGLLGLGAVVAVVAAAAVVLLAPAALVWGQAQIGGILDAARNPGAPAVPGNRPAHYWIWVTGLIAVVTGSWWAVVGAAAARWSGGLRRALEPFGARPEGRHGRVLAAVGGLLAAAGVAVLLA